MTKGKTRQNIINKKNNSYYIPDVSKLDEKVKSISIKELNSILKGEYMAIDSYENYIKNLENNTTKIEFQKIQKDHKRHAIKLAERIQSLGGVPVSSSGIKGKIVETISIIKDIGTKESNEFITKACDGEEIGIKESYKIIEGDLDKDSLTLVNSILAEDKNHVDKLSNMISHKNNTLN